VKIGHEVVRIGSVGSTMDEIDARAQAGAVDGLVVLADEQTAGRGRMGREWIAPPGSSILCSVLLRPDLTPDRLSTLPLLVGNAVAEAIVEVTGIECLVKWPNDVLIDCAKVCGILIQSRLKPSGIDFVNIGIGINVSTPRNALVEGATSLEILLGEPISREQLFVSLIAKLQTVYDEFILTRGHPTLERWRARAAFIGEEIAIAYNGSELIGRLVAVDDAGQLLLKLPSGEVVALGGGEIQRGPRYVRPGS